MGGQQETSARRAALQALLLLGFNFSFKRVLDHRGSTGNRVSHFCFGGGGDVLAWGRYRQGAWGRR